MSDNGDVVVRRFRGDPLVYQPVTLGEHLASVDMDGVRVTETIHAGGTDLAPHTHEHPAFTIVLAGAVDESVEGTGFRGDTFSVLYKPGGARHANHYSTRARSLIVELLPSSRVTLAHWLQKSDIPVLVSSGLSCALGLAVLRHFRSRSLGLTSTCEQLALDVCGRWTAHSSGVKEAGRRMDDVAEFIRGEALTPLRLAAVAMRFGYHPVYLSRAFRRRHGMSIGEYVHRSRVAAVAEAVVRSDESLASIAQRAGFSDQSHFTRIFRRFTACPPAQLRRLARAADPRTGGWM
jgi:AraC family transcriptional regulator